MTITQTVTDEDFKKAYARYYATDLMTKYRPWMGVALLASSVYLAVRMPDRMPIAIIFILFGCYLLVAKWTYIAKRLREGRRSGRLPSDMELEISGSGIMKLSAEGEHSELDLRRTYGYQVAAFGVLIYLRRNMFFLLKLDAIERAGGLETLVAMLNGFGLKRIR